MIDKRPICPERLRQIPSGFSWIDHRLIRQHRLEGCPHTAWALYLFLVSVGDAQGLSYYSDASLSRHLQMDPLQLAGARRQLEAADLIAYRKPLYQVLALQDRAGRAAAPEPARVGQVQSVGDILRRVLATGSV
ncbi:MAG TPA: hypothetical protein P5525_21755 [Candidatus Paceibacterota bacterium]|nr:hypothetical protein [Candidatus Paceibacterota bacterium]